IGLDSPSASKQGKRFVYLRREHLLHETLLLQPPPLQLHHILDSLRVVGQEHLSRPASMPGGSTSGRLLLSFHYSLVTSLLSLWLMREVVRG
ncbi:MAG TPA: hypothetical protein VGW38_29395, partial [Chloroflexota bacterium]|nr:hypothetical protein [Chloroflexota bacterium]